MDGAKDLDGTEPRRWPELRSPLPSLPFEFLVAVRSTDRWATCLYKPDLAKTQELSISSNAAFLPLFGFHKPGIEAT